MARRPTKTEHDVRQTVLAMADSLAEVQRDGEREQRLRAREEQVQLGKLNVIPLPNVATRPFRTELIVEQNSLFLSNAYKGNYFIRERPVHHPETGEELTQRLLIGKTDLTDRPRGVLTQVHQDAFYAVLQMWGARQYPVARLRSKDPATGKPKDKVVGYFTASAYEVVKAIRGDDSANHYARTRQILLDLKSIPICIENFLSADGWMPRLDFELLDDFNWETRKVDPKTKRPLAGQAQVTIQISQEMTTSFMDRNIKQLLAGPYGALGSTGKGRRGEIARLLYPFLDGQLATKTRYHAKLAALAERFGLTAYKYKSKRREKFLPAVKALDGKLILKGEYLLRVSLDDAADGDDFVLVAEREKLVQQRR